MVFCISLLFLGPCTVDGKGTSHWTVSPEIYRTFGCHGCVHTSVKLEAESAEYSYTPTSGAPHPG